MSRRLMATIVCLLMVAALVVGCTHTPAATTAPSATVASATASDATAAAPTASARKELNISMGASMSDPNADALGQWLQDYFKIKITVVAMDDTEKVKMLAASDTLPDIFNGAVPMPGALFSQLKTNGLIKFIPDDMIAKYPLLQKEIDAQSLIQAYKKTSGNVWWLPSDGNADTPKVAMAMPFYYRADWAKKLNIPAPQTIDDLYNMLKAFTFDDPDGNGKNDTYGMTGWLWQVHFITWVDMYAWVKEDGQWIPGYLSKNMLPALKFYNKLYQDGILDPEFASANAKSMFFTDKVGMFCGNSDPDWVWMNIYNGFTGAHDGMTPDEAMADVQFLPPLKADANSPASWAPNLDNWGRMISSKTTDEVLDRLLEISNWELSPDGRDFLTYGLKDTDWIVKDGKALSLLPNSPTTGIQEKVWDKYPSLNGLNIVEQFFIPGTPWFNPPLPQGAYDRSQQWQTMAGPAVIKENPIINYLSTPLKDKCTVDSSATCEPEFQKLVTSTTIDADYAALVKTWKETDGLDAVIAEVNQTIAAQGLDK